MNMPVLKVLYMQGNDFVRECPYYRKKMIGSLSNLTYLDDRPIFPEEKTLCQAFIQGGKEQMNQVIKDIKSEKELQKKLDAIENQKKSAIIKERRIIFFTNTMKRSLIEIETLKKKLNRARLICDGHMISQLEECLQKENNNVIDLENTIHLMKEG